MAQRHAQSTILFLGIMLLGGVLEAQVVQSESPYAVLERQCLSAVEWVDEEWPNEKFYDYLVRVMKYQRNPPLSKKRRAAFKILAADRGHKSIVETTILDDAKTWIDLCLFSGQHDTSRSLVEIVGRTHTELGRASLATRLIELSSDHGELMRRQRIVKELVDNPALLKKLDDFLAQFATTENILMSFWGQDLFYQSAERHYFCLSGLEKLRDYLNKSPIALDARTTLEHLRRYAWFGGSATAGVILPIYGISKLNIFSAPQSVKNMSLYLRGSGGPLLSCMMMLSENNYYQGIASIIAGGYSALSSRDDYAWAYDCGFLDRCLQEKLMTVAQSLRSLKRIDTVLQDVDTLRKEMPILDDIHALLYQRFHQSPPLKQLFDLLATSTFSGKSAFFSRGGRILVAYALMHEAKEEFVQALSAIGQLDMYVAIAKLYTEFEEQERGYCFVDFMQTDRPTITMANFWNPFIKGKRPVPNSISLGGEHDRLNVILTGPNAGGKSTILRAIALNLVLAQSFGIAAADTMSFTPFHSIATYLNITDDITAGNSLFKSEVLRAQSLLDRLHKLNPEQFSFIVIDEMFSGTSPKEGEAASYSVAKYLGSFDNSICLMATHFSLLTQLQDHTQHFANYKVSVTMADDGSMHYPFKLEPGVSTQNIAIDMLRAEGFSGDILNDAHSLIKGVPATALG